MKQIAENAIARLAAEMITESPAFIRAGMKHPRWADIRRIERRFRVAGCGDAIVDSQWTQLRQAHTKELLAVLPWNGTEARELSRRQLAADATQKHYFPA